MNTKNQGRTMPMVLAGALAAGMLSVLCAGLFAKPAPASMQAPQAAIVALEGASLERAFWACDYVATVHGADRTPLTECSAATEQLKDERFGGDFGQMLEWWREMKPAEHARMAAAMEGIVASRDAR